jgi:hypothetical protein
LLAVFSSPTMKAFLPWRIMTMGDDGCCFHAAPRCYWDFWSECVWSNKKQYFDDKICYSKTF